MVVAFVPLFAARDEDGEHEHYAEQNKDEGKDPVFRQGKREDQADERHDQETRTQKDLHLFQLRGIFGSDGSKQKRQTAHPREDDARPRRGKFGERLDFKHG